MTSPTRRPTARTLAAAAAATLLVATPTAAPRAPDEQPARSTESQPAATDRTDRVPETLPDRQELMAEVLRARAARLAEELERTRAVIAALDAGEPLAPDDLRDAARLLRTLRAERRPNTTNRDTHPDPHAPSPQAEGDAGTADPGVFDGPDRSLILAFLREHRPALAGRLTQLRNNEPDRFDAFLRLRGRHALRLAHQWRDAPELFALRREAAEAEVAARRIAARLAALEDRPETTDAPADDQTNPSAARTRLRAALERAVRREATLRLERAERELSRDREQLDERAEQIEQRRAEIDTLVRDRIDALLEDARAAPPTPRHPRGPRRGPRR